MRKARLIAPIVSAVLLASACGGGDGSTPVDPTPSGPTARVRFFNATTGMTGSGGFTANGQFASGSALASGQATPSCATVAAGPTSFGFGAANAGGTGLGGSALATLDGQTLAAGGRYTVVATGAATSPTLYLLDDGYTGTLPTNQAAVRFVNLAPGTGTTANTFVAYMGAFGAGQSPVAVNIAVGTPTEFKPVAGGANTFSVVQVQGHSVVIPSGAATLQPGTVNTLAIVQSASASAGFQLVNVPGC
ncbi:DUF4397 domain-containing protein [Roseisolibacter sp. H3M3-2]|uniref:DUF4397 domain-containing protein n=1 Tax=Roseisolibacter sp. H3M3-2 TaxID=3031323 RepID=UPI0023DCCB26|nr:DUF4397 domain-containing protein [Roseisolibacter sp. H3M3-2]MDF1502947.1 DUF4397 domain-containing protein [Roseisolibacter sp. H3M3-2]